MAKNNFRFFSIFEFLLPLVFFSGSHVFIAAGIIPLAVGLNLILLEFLRRLPAPAITACYGLSLVLCGAIGWYIYGIAPYWIWSVHVLIAERARNPSAAQRKKPFLFGLKKYSKRRIYELTIVLFLGLSAAAGIHYGLRANFSGILIWAIAAAVLIPVKIAADRLVKKS